VQCITMMRVMYHQCRLVHADLSEYNMLYWKSKLWVIDVSQSVEHDHPSSLEFLRMDCTNTSAYFAKKGVATMTTRELFDFITDPTITLENIDDYLAKIQEKIEQRGPLSPEAQVDEEVFKNAFIPRTLDQVIDVERDLDKAEKGETQEILYHTLTGMKPDLSGAQQIPQLLEEEQSETHESEGTQSKEVAQPEPDSTDGLVETETSEHTQEKSDKDEGEITSEFDAQQDENSEEKTNEDDQEEFSKKERKRLVREANREKRKNKVPKKVKKRKKQANRNKK